MKKGCYGCKHLDYYEAYFEEVSDSGYCCNKREDIDKFKKFPCKRKLKCFSDKELDNEATK